MIILIMWLNLKVKLKSKINLLKPIDSNYYILYLEQCNMEIKIHSLIITSLLAFALLAAGYLQHLLVC